MRFLYSAVYWSVFFAITVVCSTVVIGLALLLRPIDRRRRLAQYVSTFWGVTVFRANPRWSVEAHGRERLVRAGPAVICSNHQSNVDVLALCSLHGSWRWVSKIEIAYLPFVGWANWAIGTQFVRRGDKASGQRLLEGCKLWLSRGVSILMFPEGTRSQDGTLGTFKPGAFKLALETGRPIVPIVLDGTRLALRKNSADASGRTHVVVSVLEPIDVTPFVEKLDVEGLSRVTRAAIEAELLRIRAPKLAGS